MSRNYDAIVLDLDGTLLDDDSRLPERNRQVLLAAHERGVRVMIATGRSNLSSHEIVAELGIDQPAVVFNGAGLYCARRQKMLEERTLSGRTLERTLRYAERHALLPVVMCADQKLALPARDAHEEAALAFMSGLKLVGREELLQTEFVIRVSLFSRDHATSEHFAQQCEQSLQQPVYITHFPLNVLASHRSNPLQVLDIHAPCLGKGEALRILAEQHGIAPERVVAVGDATNDIPMFERAGLSVAMENGMAEARAVARRVIGSNNSDALAQLVEELFLSSNSER
ncbi:MAG: hypothetical protein RL277_182 [Planctomycetota bacterium]|jgi:Cof subfamily protein (haloacid dehalogenase superfamily)